MIKQTNERNGKGISLKGGKEKNTKVIKEKKKELKG
jgi:hypothetical protein